MNTNDHGGHVDPPDHLRLLTLDDLPKPSKKSNATPDYDTRVFRYSRAAPPCVVMLMMVSAVLFVMTLLQGSFGMGGGLSDLQEGQPRDYYLYNGAEWDLEDSTAGVKNYLYYIRFANFAIGSFTILCCTLTVLAGWGPSRLRRSLLLCVAGFTVLGCLSIASFGLSLLSENTFKECPNLPFNNMQPSANQLNYSPGKAQHPFNISADNPYNLCTSETALGMLSIAADALQAACAVLAAGVVYYTTLPGVWPWGPGRISMYEQLHGPPQWMPPPMPFTHVAETRRRYVWVVLFLLSVALMLAFCTTIAMERMRSIPTLVDENNLAIFTSGWSQRNSLFRIALAGITLGMLLFSLLDMWAIKCRILAFLLAAILLLLAAGLLVCFGFDVYELSTVSPADCPRGSGVQVECQQAFYCGTAAVDILLAFFLILYVCYEFGYRTHKAWETFYFFADSEWLRRHSMFAPDVDKFAGDWMKFQMASGKEYYYSASLGISTTMVPDGFIPPEQVAPPQPVVYDADYAPAPRPAPEGASISPGPLMAVEPPGSLSSMHLVPYPTTAAELHMKKVP